MKKPNLPMWLIAARIVMGRDGRMSIGLGYLGKLEDGRD